MQIVVGYGRCSCTSCAPMLKFFLVFSNFLSFLSLERLFLLSLGFFVVSSAFKSCCTHSMQDQANSVWWARRLCRADGCTNDLDMIWYRRMHRPKIHRKQSIIVAQKSLVVMSSIDVDINHRLLWIATVDTNSDNLIDCFEISMIAMDTSWYHWHRDIWQSYA